MLTSGSARYRAYVEEMFMKKCSCGNKGKYRYIKGNLVYLCSKCAIKLLKEFIKELEEEK